MDTEADYIHDFKITGKEIDSLNVSDLLSGYDSLSDDINNFVQIDSSSTKKSVLLINQDGEGDDWQTAATLGGNFSKTSVDDLLSDNRLVADTLI